MHRGCQNFKTKNKSHSHARNNLTNAHGKPNKYSQIQCSTTFLNYTIAWANKIAKKLGDISTSLGRTYLVPNF
jgi:hypothetical protein